MRTQDRIRLVRPDEWAPGPGTPGMDRRQAIATNTLWAGPVRTEPGMVSGWHHHGEHDSVIFVLTGSLKMEFGPAGSDTFEAAPNDFILVPRGVVHRESNPSPVPADIVVVRAGRGGSIFNVDGPDRTDGA